MSSVSIILGRVQMCQGWKGMGASALTLGDGAMNTGRGSGAATATLADGAAGVTVRNFGVIRSRKGVGGASIVSGDGGRVSTEGTRVDAGSVGVAIDVAKILAMSWISCNCLLTRVEKGVAGERVASAAVRAWAEAIAWSVE